MKNKGFGDKETEIHIFRKQKHIRRGQYERGRFTASHLSEEIRMGRVAKLGRKGDWKTDNSTAQSIVS